MAVQHVSLRPNPVTSLVQRLRDVAATDPNAQQWCQALMAPLTREDRERGNNLVATLRTYYACGARVDKTADALFLHRNSVRYRLDRIRSLLQLDVDQPQVIVALTIALASGNVLKTEDANAG